MDLHFGSYQDAEKLLDDPLSCLKAVTITKHICLMPEFLGRLRTGIKEILNSEMNLFSDELGGVLIAYNNIRRLQSGGNLFQEMPQIHLDIMVDVIVFQPKVGCLLRGEVNKINFGTNIGCLVHKSFNASIFKPAVVSAEEWQGSNLSLGEEFTFEVLKIFSNNRVLSMRGKFPRNSSLSTAKTQKSRPSVQFNADHFDDLLDGNTSVSDPVKKKRIKHKKKKKTKEVDKAASQDLPGFSLPDNPDLDTSVLLPGNSPLTKLKVKPPKGVKMEVPDDTDASFSDTPSKKSKKKKKSRHSEAPTTPVLNDSHAEIPTSDLPMDSSLTELKLKPGKSKYEENTDADISISDSSVDKKHKKKHKKDRKSDVSALDNASLDDSKCSPVQKERKLTKLSRKRKVSTVADDSLNFGKKAKLNNNHVLS